MNGCEETKRKKKISAQNALRKLDLFANSASRVKAKWRRGSLFLEGTQNGRLSSCCHGGLVRDFLGAFMPKNGQRTEGCHGFCSD